MKSIRFLTPFLRPMTVVVKRDGVVCNMDFAPDTVAVAGKITKLNRTRAENTYKMRES